MRAVTIDGYTHYFGPFTVDENMYLMFKLDYENRIKEYLYSNYPVDANTRENQQYYVKLLNRLYIMTDDNEKYKKDAISNMISCFGFERWWYDE